MNVQWHKAKNAEDRGDTNKAEKFEQRQAAVSAPVPAAAAPKPAGISTRKVWKFEVTDAAKLPPEYLVPDIKKIGKVVRALQGDTEIPGVRVYSEDTMAVRAD